MTASKTDNELTLVLGGHGKTGRRLVKRLEQAGRPVRVGSRSGEPPFDWEIPATWPAVLKGVRAVYVSYQPDLAMPGALETVQAFFARALASGVRRIALLSGRGEIEAEQAEQALQATEADWTILRASWFCQNFSESYFLDSILKGEVALPVGPVAEPFIDVDDIVDIAFAALTEPGHVGQLYEIAGPRALTFAEAIGEIARETKRDIKFVSVAPEDYRTELVRWGVPQTDIELVIYLLTTVLDGRNTPLTDGVQRALGRAPRDFTDYVRRTAATGIWKA